MSVLRVLVIGDDPLARAGLAALLATEPDCSVVGQVAGYADVVTQATVYRPDVVVWDLGWSPGPALDRLADLEDLVPPVVVLLPDDADASDAWRAGARGVLLRDADAEILVAALVAVAQGLVTLDSGLVDAGERSEGIV